MSPRERSQVCIQVNRFPLRYGLCSHNIVLQAEVNKVGRTASKPPRKGILKNACHLLYTTFALDVPCPALFTSNRMIASSKITVLPDPVGAHTTSGLSVYVTC